jgi:hypothetical protein
MPTVGQADCQTPGTKRGLKLALTPEKTANSQNQSFLFHFSPDPSHPRRPLVARLFRFGTIGRVSNWNYSAPGSVYLCRTLYHFG